MTYLKKQLEELKALASTLLDNYKFKVSHSKDETEVFKLGSNPNESLVIFRLYMDKNDKGNVAGI